MDSKLFADQFERLYRELYLRAVRRIDDGRDRLSAETTALLLHIAQMGPATLSELGLHFDRSLSTLSAKVSALESTGLLARQRDEDDARRALIWLSPAGRQALTQAMEVLDASRLAEAADALDSTRQQRLVDDLRALVEAIPSTRSRYPDPGESIP